jgi:hypothetical protein
MSIRWRTPGTEMATVDLRELDGDQIVIHYGGALNSVDAYTFANSLIAFADTVRAVSEALEPGPSLEIRVEALGPGSFRAVVKKVPPGLTKFFKRGAESILWGYVAYLIIDRIHGPPDPTHIIVNRDEVIISRPGGDKIIVPRTVYEGTPKLKADAKVQENIARTFEVIEEDDAVENFGITPSVTDVDPLVQIPREEFPRLTQRDYALIPPVEDPSGRRERVERGRLLILKLWLKANNRKWSFEWNGVPISAPIKDAGFLARLESREIVIGSGDALDVELRYVQFYDQELRIYVNDPSTFEVMRVLRIIQRETPRPLLPP